MHPTSLPNWDTVEAPSAMPMPHACSAPSDDVLHCRESTLAFHPDQYLQAISVRNTFLTFLGEDPSLGEICEKRRAHSCPAKFRENSTEEEEEVPSAPSISTACSSASTGSGTPALAPPCESSDVEEVSKLTDRELRVALNTSASALPASCTFQETVSECGIALASLRGDDRQAANCLEAPDEDMMQRQALPPGPMQGTVQPQMTASGEHIGYFLESYQSAYNNGYSNASYDNPLSNRYAGSYKECFNAGYQSALSGYILVPAEEGEEDIGQQMVLQMASPGSPGMHLPPFPGGPAPLPSPLLPTPAPPSQQPQQQLAPTRGSVLHGFGYCRPCAFLFTKGCGNGFECAFCHLCEPGEKKKRQKTKKEACRQSRNGRHSFNFGSTSMPTGQGFSS